MQKIGVLGGTFNPVHNEHILIALNAIEELNLDKLIVMPTFIPPHKTGDFAPPIDRLNMCRLAFAPYEKVEVSDYEISKGGTSYSYLTLEHLKETLNAQLYLIMGEDLITTFSTWKNPNRIVELATICVFGRSDFKADFNKEQEYFSKTFNKQFIKLKYKGKNYSSTLIRILNMFSLPLDKYLPNEVINHIKNNNLYSGEKYKFYIDFIKQSLTEKRLIHTAFVAECALRKASECNLDKEKVFISAILHDNAKYVDYTKVKGFSKPEDMPAPVIHSFLGAYIAKKILKIEDEEILDAIKYHTSGKPDMTTLGKLIFVADMVEDTREYEGVEKLREIYESQGIEQAFLACLKEEMIHLVNKKQPIYDLTLKAYAYYIK